MMCGVGLDATIVTKVNPELKARAGKLAYWVAGFGQFFHTVGQFQVESGAEQHQCGFVLASRVRNYGGDMEIASGASLLSDNFEVVLFDGSNPLRYAAYMTAVSLRQVKSMPGVKTLRARRIVFSGDAHLQIDGEYGGRIPATLEMVPDALTLLAPAAYR
jgi:diacylglycerol kinase family enzyme